jgi:uncharacterized protein YjbI with pentapeptide repeats
MDADFSGLKNLHEKFSSSNLLRCRFAGSGMSGLLLKSNNVLACDFSGSDFSRSQIQNSNFSNNLFKDCSMKETEFLQMVTFSIELRSKPNKDQKEHYYTFE